jgi:hypothetical protein
MWNSQDHEGTALDWKGFETKVDEINRETDKLKRTRELHVSEPLYRGQRDARWHLKTTLDRQRPGMTLDKYLTIMERIQPRIERVSGKKWPNLRREVSELRQNGLDSIWLFPVKSANTETILSFMDYLRQHGFPSPLLDWTSDPYRAAFFAFTGIEESTPRVAIYVHREWAGSIGDSEKEHEPTVMTVGPPIRNATRRHSKQHAEYTWCVEKTASGRCLDCYVFTDHERVINLPGSCMEEGICVDIDRAQNIVDKYTIPAVERRNALASLAQRSISKCGLFETTPDDLLEDLWNELVVDSVV